ncbi:MAG: CYTH domain-containing protein [Clostridia bacterium]|nr:CYTH domain-containing protein [Clostridia bacterium]
MTEFEKKLILSEDEYNHLMKHLGQDKMTVTQINYYFDTDDFDMNRENTTCRIRLKNGKYMATMKLHSEGNDNSTEIDLLIRNGIYDNTFIDMGLKLQGELITKRCLILQDDICEVVLDKNDYLGHTDYELEVEYSPGHENEALIILRCIETVLLYNDPSLTLKELALRCENTPNKSKRFFERRIHDDFDPKGNI